MVAKFGLKPEQFGDNLRDGYQKHETEQHPMELEECTTEFVQPTRCDFDQSLCCKLENVSVINVRLLSHGNLSKHINLYHCA